MALNYSTLKTAITNFTENDASEFTAVLDTIINLAEARIYREIDLNEFRDVNTSLTTTSGVSTVNYLSLSPRPFIFRWAAIRSPGGTDFTPLDQKDDSYIQELWQSTTASGVPLYYAIQEDGTLLLGPTPNGTYTLKLAYTVKPNSIISTSTSWLGNYAEDVLLYACLCEAYDFMKGEDQSRTRWEEKYQRAVAALRLEEERRMRRTEFRTGEQGATT